MFGESKTELRQEIENLRQELQKVTDSSRAAHDILELANSDNKKHLQTIEEMKTENTRLATRLRNYIKTAERQKKKSTR